MKKFNALLFAMALMAVVMFASVAFAAPFYGVGVDKAGNLEIITIDATADEVVQYTGFSGSPVLSNDYNIFAYSGGVVAVGSADNHIALGLMTVNDSGKPVYSKTLKGGTDTAAINDESTSGDLFISTQAAFLNGGLVLGGNTSKKLFVISNDKLISMDVSADTMFAYDSKLYVLNTGGSTPTDKERIVELSDFKQPAKSADLVGTVDSTKAAGKFSSLVFDGYVYIATRSNLLRFAVPEPAIINLPEIKSTNTGDYMSLFKVESDTNSFYTIKSEDNCIRLKKITDNGNTTPYEESLLNNVSGDVIGSKFEGSFDVAYNDTNKVLVIINKVVGKSLLSVFTNGDSGWKCIASSDRFASLAMIETAASSSKGDDTPTTTTTVVDPSTLETAAQTNLVENTPATAITDFVTATEASTSTVPTGAQAAIEAELKKDDNTTVTLAAKTNYTPAKDGYLLVKEAVDVSKVTVYFVEAATTTTTAATGDATKATLLDADCKEMGSTGTSVYAASDKLESGKTYTLVEATVSSTSPDDDNTDTGSSSSGCNAGFAAISALLALAFIKKSR